ncbi:hypothetical protein FRB94_003278 [Tulasnella sp. JGI-2019a]|nr:hypothetical protein FRB94_003278 [Tulasnella sp. JGI-2019a]
MVAQIYGWAITEEFITKLTRKQDIGTESQREDGLWVLLNVANWLDRTFTGEMVRIQDGRPIRSESSKRSGYKCVGPRGLVIGIWGDYYISGNDEKKAEVLSVLGEMKEVLGFDKPASKYKRY